MRRVGLRQARSLVIYPLHGDADAVRFAPLEIGKQGARDCRCSAVRRIEACEVGWPAFSDGTERPPVPVHVFQNNRLKH